MGSLFDTPRSVQIIPPARNLKSIRVVTWNIDRGTNWRLLISELRHDPPDLCLFQEVDWNTTRTGRRDIASEMANQLRLNCSYGIEFEELSQESGQKAFIGQANLTRLPVRQSRILRFRAQSGFWKPQEWIPSSVPLMQRRLGGRMALVTELEFAGRPLVVYNAHLESRSTGHLQAQQLDEILLDLKKYPRGTATILAGDLNTKYFPSRFLAKLERAGFRSALGERIERTHVIVGSLDWIFASGPVALQAGKVLRNFRGSDHYPVYAELIPSWRDAPI